MTAQPTGAEILSRLQQSLAELGGDQALLAGPPEAIRARVLAALDAAGASGSAAEAAALRREHLLGLLAEASARLNREPDFERALTQVLPLLGRIPDVDRVLVLEAGYEPAGDEWVFSQYLHWDRADAEVHPRVGELQQLSLSHLLPDWPARLQRGETIQGLLEDFSAQEQVFLRARGCRALLAVPVFCEQTLWGLVVFNNTHSQRLWSSDERSLFETFASNLGAALERLRSRQALEGLNADLTRHIGERDRVLAEREALLRNLIDSMQDLIFYKDPQGRYLGCNRAFERFTGLSQAELLGKRDAEIFTDAWLSQAAINQDQALAREEWRHVFTVLEDRFAPGEVRAREGWLYRRDGQRIYLETRKMGYYEAGGELIGYLGVSRDLTERKLVENALIVAREKAEAASRAKSDFLANMSHEIRTPMNAIIGLNHLLLRSGLAARQADHVHKIQSAAQNLLGIINDILDFSKIEAGKLRMERIPFSLAEIGANLSNLLSDRAQEKGLHFELRLPPLAGQLIGDPLRLEQVLLNLAGNAIKFTSRGEVEVSGEVLEADTDWVQLCFRVRDTGIGIAPAEQGKLFQAFSQADSSTTRKYGGTGLGLMISKRLVKMMKGEIGFESEPGQGSTFWLRVRFPREPAGQGPRRHLAARRLLVVDDQAELLALFKGFLKGTPCELDIAASGREALEQIEARSNRGERYDLLLVDLKLDDMDGLALIEQCWQRLPQRPRTLLMTGHGRESVLARAAQLPIDGLLLKPLTRAQLHEAIWPLRGDGLAGPAEAATGFSASLDAVRGARILLVEDNEINQIVARELLEAEGFTIEVASDGQQALERLQSGPAFDLVLLDLHMPVMDGYETIRLIRLNPDWQGLPVLAMTADAIAGIREQVLAAGMNDYITKPIALSAFYSALLRWLPIQPAAALTALAASPAAELPALPGLEAREALQRLGGNLGLYLRLLKSFAAELPEKLEALARCLSRQEPEPALELAHMLKGTCGNLGFAALHECLSACEAALRHGGAATAQEHLALAQAQLGTLLPALAQLSLPEPAASELGLEQGELRQRLRAALQNFDPSAMELVQALRACHERPGLCDGLMDLIEQFDFEAALQCWDALEPRLEGRFEGRLEGRFEGPVSEPGT